MSILKEHIGCAEDWDIGPITQDDLYKLIDKLKPKKSTGEDGISYYHLKVFKFEIGPLLLFIINSSIVAGEFLEEWKLGKIVPIFKGKGSDRDPASYRPVTLTSVIGRIVKQAVRSQFIGVLDSKILTANQYGFRSGSGTAKCLNNCIDEIRRHLIMGEKTAIVAVDGSCAFDLVPRDLLKELIAAAGAGKSMMRWLEDYFTNRKQYVDIGARSKTWTVEVGTIQGGPISPDFYNIISSTQTLWNKFATSFQFADDDVENVSSSTEQGCNVLI